MLNGNVIKDLLLLKTGFKKAVLKKKFTKIYNDNLFQGDESRSGQGSSLGQTAIIRQEIPRLLKTLNATSLIDAPCGDLFWIKEMELPVEKYIGIDIVAAIIKENTIKYADHQKTFLLRDLTADKLPKADVFLCRDCLVHLSFGHIKKALKNIKRSGSRYLLTTTFPNTNENIDLGNLIWRPLNFEKPPFNFSPPIQMINEGCSEDGGKYKDKSLGLWLIQHLPY